jgi:hypothetical protein
MLSRRSFLRSASMGTMAAAQDQGAGYRVAVPGLSVEVGKQNGRLEKISVHEKLLPLTGGVQLLEDFKEAGLSGERELSAAKTHLLYRVKIRASPGARSLLECRLVLDLGDGAGWRWWDGVHEPVPIGAAKTRAVPDQGLFPACALWNGAVGIGLGLPPDSLCSYYGSAITPKEKGATIHYSIRRAVNPGEAADFAFVLFGFDAGWGVRSVVDGYYRVAATRVDPAQIRPDALGLYALVPVEDVHKLGDRFIEYCRRARVGGMELYAPFSRTGEFFTNQEPAYVRRPQGSDTASGKQAGLLNPDTHVEPVKLSQEQLKEVYTISNIASLTLSYVIPTKCERKLALERFDDSIVRLANGERYIQDAWQVMPGERLAGMDAGETAFGAYVRSALRNRIERYHPEGIYLDNGAVNWSDYGNDRMFPAFDDNGKVYVNVGLAYALICDFLHKTRPGIWVNPGESIQYFSAFRGNSYLSNTIWKFPEYGQAHRFLIGKKAMYFGAPRFFDRKVLLAEIAQVPGREKMFGRFTKYPQTWAILQAFRWGALPWFAPRYDARPDARLLGTALADLAQAGWEPIPHARVDSLEVWLERFQRGTQSLLFSIINPTGRDLQAVVTIDDKLHPRGRLPLCAYYAGTRPVKHELPGKERVVRIPLELKANSATVLRAAGWIDPPESEIELTLRRPAEGDPRVKVSVTRGGWQAAGWEVNPIEGTADRWDPVKLDPVAVHAGDEITIAWTSRYQVVGAGCRLEEVKFLREAAPLSVVMHQDSPEFQANARRIAGFAMLQAELLRRKANCEIVTHSDKASHPARVFILPQDAAGRIFPKARTADPTVRGRLVAIDPQTLLLTGKTEWDMRLVLNKYLDTIEAPLPFDGEPLDEVLVR